MTKYDYLTELKHRLHSLPESERINAVNHYDRYFTQSGPENEELVMKRLGTPRELAEKIIRESHNTIPGIVNETKRTVKTTAKKMKDPKKHRSFFGAAFMLLFGGIVMIVTIAVLLFIAIIAAGALAAILVFGFAMIGMSIPYLFSLTSIGFLVLGIGLVCVGLPLLIFIPVMNIVFYVIKRTVTAVAGALNGMLKRKAG